MFLSNNGIDTCVKHIKTQYCYDPKKVIFDDAGCGFCHIVQ